MLVDTLKDYILKTNVLLVQMELRSSPFFPSRKIEGILIKNLETYIWKDMPFWGQNQSHIFAKILYLSMIMIKSIMSILDPFN